MYDVFFLIFLYEIEIEYLGLDRMFSLCRYIPYIKNICKNEDATAEIQNTAKEFNAFFFIIIFYDFISHTFGY